MYITNKVQPSNDCFFSLFFSFYGFALAAAAAAFFVCLAFDLWVSFFLTLTESNI